MSYKEVKNKPKGNAFRCVVSGCEAWLRTLDEFTEHLKGYHKIKNSHCEDTKIQCVVENCTKSMQAGALVRHIISHVHALRVRCAVCGADFSRKESLERHRKVKHPASS